MAKERKLTILVPIKSGDYTVWGGSAVPVLSDFPDMNTIYQYGDKFYRKYRDENTGTYSVVNIVDREFPYIGRPLEIFDFEYNATRMGKAPTITAQNVMWYAEKDANGNDVTLDDLWRRNCHVVFNSENFYLSNIPTCTKNEEDARYQYNIDFVSERVTLENVYLYDVVRPFVTDRHLSESASFSFYGNINELTKRINASLLKCGLSSLEYLSGVTDGSFLTYEEFNGIGIGTYKTDSSSLSPFTEDVYLKYRGNYTLYLLNNVYKVINPSIRHIGDTATTLLTAMPSDWIDNFNKYLTRNSDGTFSYITGSTAPAFAQGVYYKYTYGIDEIYDGDFSIKGYRCVIGRDKYGVMTTSEEKLITFDNNTIHEALQKIHDVFELQYYIGKDSYGSIVINISDCEHDFADMNTDGTDYTRDAKGIPTSLHPFDYGVDDALLSKEMTGSTEKIITRITGVGSSENVPWYYPNPNADGWIAPMYKRDGVAVTTVSDSSGVSHDTEINYPNSEGDTTVENVRYEKYLKCRIGDVFQYGNAVIIKYPTDAAQSTGLVTPTAFEIGFVVNIDFDNAVMDSTIQCAQADTATVSVKKDGVAYTPSFNILSGHGTLPRGHYVIKYGWQAAANIFSYTGNIYYFYQGFGWDATGFSTQAGLRRHYRRTGVDDSEEYWYDGDGNEVELIQPVLNEVYYVYHDNDASNGLIDALWWDRLGVTGLTRIENVTASVYNILSTMITGNIKVSVSDGWYRNGKKTSLAEYGITNDAYLSSIADIRDTIEFRRIKYITPQQRLMPELYIRTDGERRFYDARNYYVNGSLITSGSIDANAGEEYASAVTNTVRNNIYKADESSPDNTHYYFENEYIPLMPTEHIEVFEDEKPTIKGQNNSVISGGITTTFRIDVVEEFAYDEFDNDEIWESSEDGTADGEYQHPYFFAKLRPLGFNIFDLAMQNDMVLSMTTGNCGACNFKIAVNEDTKKNPVQIWEYDVYEKNESTYTYKYAAGSLRRIMTDTSRLYYNISTDGTPEYIRIDGNNCFARNGFIIDDAPGTVRAYRGRVSNYTSAMIINGEVGSLKYREHTEGDVMTSGRYIDRQQDTSSGYVWVALTKDTDTYGTVMPSAKPDYGDGNYSTYIEPRGHVYTDRKNNTTTTAQDIVTDSTHRVTDDTDADNFVITNIRMPQIYLRRAERNLSRKIVAYMYDHNYYKINFSQKFSRIFLAENDGIEARLNENSVLYIRFNNKIFRQYVKSYSYKMSQDSALPEISVVLNNELSVSRTYVEQQQALRVNDNEGNHEAFRRFFDKKIEIIGRNMVRRNGDTVIGGNVVSREAVTSFGELSVEEQGSKIFFTDTQYDVETNHFKKKDFVLTNGKILKIGANINFAPAFIDASGKRIVEYGGTDGEESVSMNPAFIDASQKRIVEYGFAILSSEPDDWQANYGNYFTRNNGIFIRVQPVDGSAPSWQENTYYEVSNSAVTNVISPADKSKYNMFVSEVGDSFHIIKKTIEERLIPVADGATQIKGCEGAGSYYFGSMTQEGGMNIIENFWYTPKDEVTTTTFEDNTCPGNSCGWDEATWSDYQNV